MKAKKRAKSVKYSNSPIQETPGHSSDEGSFRMVLQDEVF